MRLRLHGHVFDPILSHSSGQGEGNSGVGEVMFVHPSYPRPCSASTLSALIDFSRVLCSRPRLQWRYTYRCFRKFFFIFILFLYTLEHSGWCPIARRVRSSHLSSLLCNELVSKFAFVTRVF